MDSSNALHNPLEELGDQVLNFVHLAHFQYFLEFGQEESFFDTVGEGPVLEESLEERDSESAVFGEEEHGASQELLVERGACLNFVQGNNNILEENHMLVPKGNGKAGDNGCEDIKKLSSSVEFVCLMDEGVEALIDSLSNHLSSGNQLHINKYSCFVRKEKKDSNNYLCIELVENVFQIVSLDTFLRVKQLQELLNELWSDIHLQTLHVNSFVDHQLEEELINSLEMRPGRVNLIVLFDTCL